MSHSASLIHCVSSTLLHSFILLCLLCLLFSLPLFTIACPVCRLTLTTDRWTPFARAGNARETTNEQTPRTTDLLLYRCTHYILSPLQLSLLSAVFCLLSCTVCICCMKWSRDIKLNFNVTSRLHVFHSTTTTARKHAKMYSMRSLRAVSLSTSRVAARGLIRSIATTPRYQQQSSSTASPSGTAAGAGAGAGSSNTSKATDRASQIASETPRHPTTANISKTGLSDKPLELETSPEEKIDWTRSFHGLSAEPFPKEAADILLAPTDPEEVEIKPDGILYLPEIKYRRILNRAFGPGGWGLVPRSESIVTPKTVTREYALVCNGR